MGFNFTSQHYFSIRLIIGGAHLRTSILLKPLHVLVPIPHSSSILLSLPFMLSKSTTTKPPLINHVFPRNMGASSHRMAFPEGCVHWKRFLPWVEAMRAMVYVKGSSEGGVVVRVPSWLRTDFVVLRGMVGVGNMVETEIMRHGVGAMKHVK
ncbi:hypothetical protein EX30DRAFT_99184 [Ascodesmis nigricans]|uniref:Uncharacterized protein n=1 Tax=Ascodesmis nigricans TaxID=341454 RepID=A0A4S2N4H2_9PEZI|nr:hypothetical protein EX30DRAFT_99184 [Ascodesmis nigricans]